MIAAGTYGDIYNFPMQQYESALDEVKKIIGQEKYEQRLEGGAQRDIKV